MLHISKHELTQLFNGSLHNSDRLMYPAEDTTESIEATVVSRVQRLRQELGAITLVDGAFDVPHVNHEWYLRHCKVIGMFALLHTQGHTDITMQNAAAYLQAYPHVASASRLITTVDADSKIAAKKSGLSAKGGVERPIYPWIGRAERLAGYHFELNGQLHQTVDLVTVEGDPQHKGTPLESSLTLAQFLASENLLDNLVVYGEHSSTIATADELGLNPIVISDTEQYAINPQTNREWSSSDIIRRAQGETVANPVTRPSTAL